jgi:C-terminal processing protease CtpA/Prc
VNRSDFHDLRYLIDVLVPRGSQSFKLRSPEGEEGQVMVNFQTTPSKTETVLANSVDYSDLMRRGENEDHAWRSEIVENGDAAFWKWESFNIRAQDVDKAISVANKHKTLILDLRGNSGGSADTLVKLAGALFDHDVKICDRMGRKEGKPIIAQRHGQAFDGKLIVLVDSASAFESELLARVVQIEHRGTVIGDKTAGYVMEAKYYKEAQGVEPIVNFGFNVTDANLIMSDGKSLENTGVTPDELLLPTAADLAAGRDPVLVRAAELAGVKLDPVEAGKMFPFEWQRLP